MRSLFEPFHVGSLTLKNRFVRSATAESRCDSKGFVKEKLFPIYDELANGGVGLIISGHTYVHPERKCSPNQTGIWSDDHIPGLAKLAAACRAHGTKAVAQLNSATRKPSEMSEAELAETADTFASAAKRAEEAGFDGVQIHAAHGYLLSAFLTPSENTRTDGYGCDASGRRRLLVEVCARICSERGAGFALHVKLGAVDGRDSSLSLAETVGTARELERAGVEAIEVSCTFGGDHVKAAMEGINKPDREGYFSTQARAVRAAVSVPVMLVGGMRSLSVMEQAVRNGVCDLISMSRPFIREPDLVNSLQKGTKAKATCISCGKCFKPRGFECVFNKKSQA